MRADLVTRIIELAGEQVAKQLVSEYGGESFYIRKTLKPGNFVRCGDCANHVLQDIGPYYSPLVSCGITNASTSLNCWRACDKFTRANPDFQHLANHFGLSIDEITHIATGRKAA